MDSAEPTLTMGDDQPEEELLLNHRRLVDWVTKDNRGYLHPDVRIAHSPSKGYHLVVACDKTIESNTRIVSCPMSATISVLNVLDIPPFDSHGTKLPKTFLNDNVNRPELLQTVFLMDQYILGENSWWSSYIKTLPTPEDVNELQFDTAEDLAWLEGTNLKGGLVTHTTKWQEMYSKALRDLKILGWPQALRGEYTWELFRWAATMFGSRSFTSEVLADTEPADRARMGGRMGVKRTEYITKLFSDRFAVLLPLLDILNHRPAAQVEWQARSTFVGLQVLDTIESGEELCNNYGPRENEGLLMSYGFTIEGNPFDHVGVSLRVPPGSPIDDARTWEQDPRSHPEHKAFMFGPAHFKAKTALCLEASLFSFDLLDALSVLKMNDRELSEMYSNQQTLMSRCLGKPHNFDDFRNFHCVLGQLLQDCRANIQKLRRTHPSKPPSNGRQRHAKVYRDSQQNIYETAAALCLFVLRRACMDGAHDSDPKNTMLPLSKLVATAFESFTQQHDYITRTGELHTVESLMTHIPHETGVTLRDTTDDIQDHLHIHPTVDPSGMGRQKARFVVFLSVVYSEYERGVSFPSRLRQWLRQVSGWYPPEDPNWSYVPSPGPWAPGEEPPLALVQLLKAASDVLVLRSANSTLKDWLKPQRICWAWNVVEEEGVIVPKDVLQIVEPNSNDEQLNVFLLYVSSR